jgi:hypothetical protein
MDASCEFVALTGSPTIHEKLDSPAAMMLPSGLSAPVKTADEEAMFEKI